MMKRKLGIARCGLACCLCSENITCNGCNSGEYDSRKIGFLFTTIEFTFEQAKAWKTQVYGTLYKYWWHKNIEVEIYLTI